MKTYPISSNQTEEIDFKATDENQFALVHRVKFAQGYETKTIVMNHREATQLYEALGEELNKKQEGNTTKYYVKRRFRDLERAW